MENCFDKMCPSCAAGRGKNITCWDKGTLKVWKLANIAVAMFVTFQNIMCCTNPSGHGYNSVSLNFSIHLSYHYFILS